MSVSAPASQVGLDILKRSGNAVDAAVATAFALAVTWPEAGNIGGGGFMLIYPRGQEPVVIDYRETAPRATGKMTFSETKSHLGHRIAGVPGTVAGLAKAHEKFGKLPWKDVVLPAVKLADEGFILDAFLARALNSIVAKSTDYSELCRVYGKENGTVPWRAGDRLVLKDLARTLRLIAHEGPNAFYKGAIADKIVAEMKAGGGYISKDDLAGYKAIQRAALHGTYRGCDVYCPPPPAGGVVLLEMLNILEGLGLHDRGSTDPTAVHLIIEAMRRGLCDRVRYIGDPDLVHIPVKKLISKEHAKALAQTIQRDRATPSADLAPDIAVAPEGEHTTHFSIIDRDGMAVANTYTLEESYGSRVVVRGAGFLLNNEMGDFNWRPGHTDRRGAIGTPANLVAPGKRMLSSQTPTIIAKNGKVLFITGSPGGRTIINTVLLVVLNVLEFDMPAQDAVDAPRFHHQWLPDKVVFEAAWHQNHADPLERLRGMGHTIDARRSQQGDAHSIWVDSKTGVFVGCPDSRRHGTSAGY